jgi:hypothetical protein
MNNKYSLRRRLVYLIVLLLIPMTLPAQQDSLGIRYKTLKGIESDQMFIQLTRDFILSSLKAGNTTEAYEAYHSAEQNYSNTRFQPFWTYEKILLGYWFGEYDIVYMVDSIEYEEDKLFPLEDDLEMELTVISTENRSALMEQIDSLVSDREKHDYLMLFFDWFINGAPGEGRIRDELEVSKEDRDFLEKDLTPRAEAFLAAYNNSGFIPFVQKHFRYVYRPGSLGLGYHLGAGALIPQSAAGQYLSPEASLGGGLDISWGSILFELGAEVGIPAKIRKPFTYEGRTWNKDISPNYYTYSITSGLVVEESPSFKIVPHIGIGGINISIVDAEIEKAGGDLSMTEAAIQFGITWDIKLDLYSIFIKSGMWSYSGVRLGIDYYQFIGSNPIMSGGMLRFVISLIDFTRPLIRDM